jgi:hypothetical protein
MDSTLTDAQQKLSDFMSNISEEAYTAGWMSNLEYVLWEAVLNGARKYGHYFINQIDIDTLIKLSDECNCWIYFDNDTWETAIPLSEWREKYNTCFLQSRYLTKG